ncbi:MAG: E3 binding domain-containing protein, partial [Caldilineales bacterium]|nr:E3 binding domain-containing protein [Caldilineales bacterium]
MEIVMPRLGLTMTEGTLAQWLKQPGDAVAAGEILFLFESEKSTMEYEAPVDGVLGEILVAAGATVVCGTPVAVLETARGEEQVRRGGEESGVIIASSSHLLIASSIHQTIATPAAKRRARELGVDLATLAGRGPNGRVQLADVEQGARGQGGKGQG